MILSCKNINFGYQQNFINDLSLDLKANFSLGITGPSGRGKSTLAKILAGHIKPNSGSVYLKDREITGKPNPHVILIHQNTDLFPWQTVRGHLKFVCNDDEKINRYLKMVKLWDYQNFRPYQLSGGMRKRLALARALVINPSVIIFDETFSSLDQNLKEELFLELKEILKTENISFIYIGHIQDEIQKFCDGCLTL